MLRARTREGEFLVGGAEGQAAEEAAARIRAAGCGGLCQTGGDVERVDERDLERADQLADTERLPSESHEELGEEELPVGLRVPDGRGHCAELQFDRRPRRVPEDRYL